MKEFITSYSGLILSFILVNGITFLAGAIGVGAMTSESNLRKKGYTDEDVELTKKISDRTPLWLFPSLLAGQIIICVLIVLIEGDITSRRFLSFAVPGSFFFALPMALISVRKSMSDYRKRAESSGADVVVDFNRSIQRLIFRPAIEIPVSIAVLAFTVTHIPLESALIVYIYIGLPWIFFGGIRLSRNLTTPVFKHNYSTNAKLTHIYQGILITLLVLTTSGTWAGYTRLDFILFFVLIAVLLGKLGFYLSKLPEVKRRLVLDRAA